MCPLNKNCPNKINGRWPVNNIASTTPLGFKCMYAHSLSEI